MGKKLLFVIAGPRLAGSTAHAARIAAEAAREAGNEVTVAELPRLRGGITGCVGCYGCQHGKEYRCVIDDGITELVASVPEYDVVVIASPVYFFSMSSQSKAFLDRFFCLLKYVGGHLETPLARIRLGFIATAEGDESGSGVKNIYKIIRDCAEYTGSPKPGFLFFGHCSDPKKFKADPDIAEKAAKFGRKL